MFSKYFLWLWLRMTNKFDQMVPSFPGWSLKYRNAENLTKTILTYLPPITTKVTYVSTIMTYLDYLKTISDETNMPYVNVTLDVGAAINAFKATWNHPERFRNIFIHLGDFHFMKENFQVRAVSI